MGYPITKSKEFKQIFRKFVKNAEDLSENDSMIFDRKEEKQKIKAELKALEEKIRKVKELNAKTGKQHCPMCLKPMKMQIDSITKRKSKYLWRCEHGCMAKNMEYVIG